MTADGGLPPPRPTAPTPPPSQQGDRGLLSEPTRQAPIALVFIAWHFVRRLGWSAIVAVLLLVRSGGLTLGAVLVPIAFVLLVFSVLSWLRFTFCVDGDELVLTKGVVSVQRLVIPLDRVQSVAIDQQLMHRAFDLVRVGVDTAGSSEVEFDIAAIDRPRADALRRIAADARETTAATTPTDASAPLPPPPTPDRVMLRRRAGDLVKIGATSLPWAGLVALAPIIAFGEEFDTFLSLGDRIDSVVEQGGEIGGASAAGFVILVVGTFVVITALGALLQITREFLTNWDLTLTRTATGLRRTAGLLNTTSRSSTLRRVQSIATRDAPPQRWIGITHLRLRTFGDSDISLPGSSPDEVAEIRSIVFGTASPPPLDRSISRWWVYRTVRSMVFIALALAVILWFAVGWWSTLAGLLVPIRFAAARRQWRLRRWGIGHGRIAESYELITRHSADVPMHKAQVVTVSQSRFERRRGLATVDVQTAGGHLAVPMIEADDAAAVRDLVLDVAETDGRRFI